MKITAVIFLLSTLTLSAFADTKCGAYYTTNVNNLYSHDPKPIKELATQVVAKLPAKITLADQNYRIEIHYQPKKFESLVFSKKSGQVIHRAGLSESDAQTYEEAFKLVLQRFTFATGTKFQGQAVYVHYNCMTE